MTRGRRHNLVCVNIEPAGDEHQHRQSRTVEAALAAAMRRSNSERSATEALRGELHHIGQISKSLQAAITDSPYERCRHSLDHETRPYWRRQPYGPSDSRSPAITATGPEV
jgi:hypothetical protein